MTSSYELQRGDISIGRRRSSGRAKLTRRLLALCTAAAAAFPASALADEVNRFAGGGGAYVSFTWGDELGVGWGLEGSLFGNIAPSHTCTSATRAGMGALLQLGFINVSKLRWVAAAQGGGQVDGDESIGFLGEAGVAGHVRLEDGDPGVGVHTGLLMQTPYYLTAFVRAEWLLDDYSVGHSVRYPGTFGAVNTCVDGRPLRDASGRAVGLGAFGTPGADEAADAWGRSAQAEAASVPAFLQLAAELLAHDAPADLVERALDAAEDEIRHARICAAMASRFSGHRERPTIPTAPLRAPLPGQAGLARLAVESWIDGCLGEGAAAARARFAAKHTSDARVRSASATIARDEARHAELGWDVLGFALRAGGPEVGDQVRACRDTFAVDPAAPERDQLRWGVLGSATSIDVDTRAARAARRRLDGLLPRAAP